MTSTSETSHVEIQDGWMSIPQAAQALRISRHTVIRLALKGALVSDLVAGRTVINRESVERYIAARAAPKV